MEQFMVIATIFSVCKRISHGGTVDRMIPENRPLAIGSMVPAPLPFRRQEYWHDNPILKRPRGGFREFVLSGAGG